MKKVVLIVDDEPSIRKLLSKVCEIIGVDHVEACCVVDAIALLDSRGFDLVVSDLNMPGETGLQILDHLRSANGGIPVIIFSGSLTEMEEAKALKMGANLVLTKPAGIAVLEENMSRFLGSYDAQPNSGTM